MPSWNNNNARYSFHTNSIEELSNEPIQSTTRGVSCPNILRTPSGESSSYINIQEFESHIQQRESTSLLQRLRLLSFTCSWLSWLTLFIIIIIIVVAIVTAEIIAHRRSITEEVFCYSIKGQRIYENTTIHDIRIEVLESCTGAAYAISMIICWVIGGILWHRKRMAQKGDEEAANGLILPCYEPILWIINFISTAGLIITIITYSGAVWSNDILLGPTDNASLDCTYNLAPLIWKSVLLPILFFQRSITKRTIIISTILGCLAMSIFAFIFLFGDQLKASIRAYLLVVYFAIFILVFLGVIIKNQRRYTIALYHAFSLLWYTLLFIYYILLAERSASDAFLLIPILLSSCFPILIVIVLQEDTRYWRGFGHEQSQSSHTDQVGDVQLSHLVSSYHVHHMIDIHRRHIIDFAYLKFMDLIGFGATASVYEGVLKGKYHVAIKVYTPPRITLEEVKQYSYETAINGYLAHSSIVSFYGLCVLPPTICLVFEYCKNGSLEEILKTYKTDLEWIQTLKFMKGCIESIAFLHSLNPPILHGDIKAANYMCTEDLQVKLTDFGEATILYENQPFTKVTGTVAYMAPEMIREETPYTIAADVYSLTITLWTILYPKAPLYRECKSNFDVYNRILAGHRPQFSSQCPKNLEILFLSGWHDQPSKRLTAGEMLNRVNDLIHRFETTNNE